MIPYITDIFKISLSSSYVPDLFKQAVLIRKLRYLNSGVLILFLAGYFGKANWIINNQGKPIPTKYEE